MPGRAGIPLQEVRCAGLLLSGRTRPLLTAGCTGTIVFNIAGSLAHFNLYTSPRGQSFNLIETDPGSVLAGSETRVSS